MKIGIQGFDDFVPSTEPSTREPSLGLFSCATPEYFRELEEKRRLVNYIEQRFVHFVEPEVDSLH
jgi:hypothetical protein